MSSTPSTIGLEVITSPSSPTLVVDPASFAMVTSHVSLVASVPMPSILLMTTPVTPSTVITTKPMETSPSGITHSPEVIEVKKEFIAELVDNFYKILGDAFHWS